LKLKRVKSFSLTHKTTEALECSWDADMGIDLNIFQGSAIAKEHCATEIPCFHVFLCLISCNQNLTYLCDFYMHRYSGKRSMKVMKITNKRDIIARIVVRKLLLQMSATNRSPGRWQYF
jgi:hypothetical protein